MTQLDILARAGLTVTADGNRLLVQPRHLLTDDLRTIIRNNKPYILAALSGAVNDSTNPAMQKQDSLCRANVETLVGLLDQSRPALTTGGGLPRLPDWDERRTCMECRNLSSDGRCLAAWRGELYGVSRDHEPVKDILQRCSGYAPGPDDTDQREDRFAAFKKIRNSDQSI
ncbi:hypothetical protein [Collimonas sp. OK412]|uniref:hypothetical protein n=1 Tax=Collimonas sp. (strain OK412) TaxID=1801619 RepID=UPI0008DF9FA2|nr:hypothetical protein [Collimonas sp. OK412]SFC62205.1 hypothetical protein SAMN04515619_11079 [Collimonas sp. OK412]